MTPLPEKIYSDAKVFRQVIINLVNNALKFTPHGRIEISMSITAQNEHPFLVIDVADTGAGIRPDFISRLFQPFSKGSESPLPGQRGAGLGLALSKDLSRAVGGDLLLKRTAMGLGTTFTFFVDAGFDRSIAEQEKIRAMPEDQNPRSWKALLQGTSVLVADDTPDISNLVKRILEKYGVSVDICDNGTAAIERTKQKNFDAVLLDLSMPGLDGFETARQIRAQGYANPIFALSAFSSADYRRRSRLAGFSGFLQKPLNNEELLRTIATTRRKLPEAERRD